MLKLIMSLLLLVVVPVWQARADSFSDSFGVRTNSNFTSHTANFHEFSGALVNDKTLNEINGLGDSSDNQITFELFSSPFFNEPGNILPTPCPSNQACLANGARVNLGVEGHAFLREPATFEFSDRVTIVFKSTGVSGSNLVDVTITLDSDPFSGNFSAPAGTIIDENGKRQDVSSRLFNLPSDPNRFGETVLDSNSTGFPFHVFAQSDVPEPASGMLMATAILGWLIFHHARRGARGED